MRRLLFLFIILFSIHFLSAQEIENDLELWLKAGAEADFGERLEIALEEQIRFDKGASELKNYHTEVEIKYQFLKWLDIRFIPRFIRVNDNEGSTQGYENHFRYQVGFGSNHKAGQFRLKNRAVFQERDELGRSEAEGDILEKYFRLRSKVEYKIKNWKYDPQVTVEYFQSVNQSKTGDPDGFRVSIGTERDLDEFGELSFEYQWDTTLNSILITERRHIFQFSYTYKF